MSLAELTECTRKSSECLYLSSFPRMVAFQVCLQVRAFSAILISSQVSRDEVKLWSQIRTLCDLQILYIYTARVSQILRRFHCRATVLPSSQGPSLRLPRIRKRYEIIWNHDANFGLEVLEWGDVVVSSENPSLQRDGIFHVRVLHR